MITAQRLVFGGSVLLNLALLRAYGDVSYEHQDASIQDIVEVNRVLDELRIKDRHVEVYNAVLKTETGCLTDLRDSYRKDFEEYQKDPGNDCGQHTNWDVVKGYSIKRTVFHNHLSTQRVCYAFLLRQGAYALYAGHRLQDMF